MKGIPSILIGYDPYLLVLGDYSEMVSIYLPFIDHLKKNTHRRIFKYKITMLENVRKERAIDIRTSYYNILELSVPGIVFQKI